MKMNTASANIKCASSKSRSEHSEKTYANGSASKSNKIDKMLMSSASSKKENKHQSQIDKRLSKQNGARKDSKKNTLKGTEDKNGDDGMKSKDSNRRSTERYSSDNEPGSHSSSKSFPDSSTSFQIQKLSQDTIRTNDCSNAGNSRKYDKIEQIVTLGEVLLPAGVSISDIHNSTSIRYIAPVKLIKPKFASNIYEARRLMKIRKKLGKIEKQGQFRLINAGVSLNGTFVSVIHDNAIQPTVTCGVAATEAKEDATETEETVKQRPKTLKKTAYKTKNKKSNVLNRLEADDRNDVQIPKISDNSVESPSQAHVFSKESWDAIEAKHLGSLNCNSYIDSSTAITDVTDDIYFPENKKTNEREPPKEDCLYLSYESDKSIDFLNVVNSLISYLEAIIHQRESLVWKRCAVNRGFKKDLNEKNYGLPKKQRRSGAVKKTSKYYSKPYPNNHNNNNKRSHQLIEDKLDCRTNHNGVGTMKGAKASTSTQTKKAKLGVTTAAKTSGNQRYSLEDLYKPRQQLISSRRSKATENKDMN